MPKAPHADRIEFWKFQHASVTFGQVKDVCDVILKEKIGPAHSLHIPLMIALHTLYGRPFKQRKDVRISEQIVPKELKDVHDSLITSRDKVHAHADVDGPRTAADNSLNKVAIFIRDSNVRCATTMIFPREIQIEKIRSLVNALSQKTQYHAEKVWKRNIKKEFVRDGDYEVNLSKSDDEFLKTLSW